MSAPMEVRAPGLIYVQIPAYRDAELAPTLRSLYAKASRPDRLRVRVVWQHAFDDVLPDDVTGLPNLEVDAVPAADSEGCNWARRRLQAAWRGEPYSLLPTRTTVSPPGGTTILSECSNSSPVAVSPSRS